MVQPERAYTPPPLLASAIGSQVEILHYHRGRWLQGCHCSTTVVGALGFEAEASSGECAINIVADGMHRCGGPFSPFARAARCEAAGVVTLWGFPFSLQPLELKILALHVPLFPLPRLWGVAGGGGGGGGLMTGGILSHRLQPHHQCHYRHCFDS
jgi:hypothetical protein